MATVLMRGTEHQDDMQTRQDYDDFLVWEKFKLFRGAGEDDVLKACVQAAYGDFQRTLHGMGKLAEGEKQRLKETATDALVSFLRQVRSASDPNFFDWQHKSVCQSLKEKFLQFEHINFSIGHAQKWVNMTLKYIFVLGEERIDGFKNIYCFCHAPIDAFFLKNIDDDHKNLVDPWSKLDCYDRYIRFQKWFRKEFDPRPPLDAEFEMWMKASREQRFKSSSSNASKTVDD